MTKKKKKDDTERKKISKKEAEEVVKKARRRLPKKILNLFLKSLKKSRKNSKVLDHSAGLLRIVNY